jgi:hypothetical protein
VAVYPNTGPASGTDNSFRDFREDLSGTWLTRVSLWKTRKATDMEETLEVRLKNDFENLYYG